VTDHAKGRNSAGGRTGSGSSPPEDGTEAPPSVVIRDRRKIRLGDEGKVGTPKSGKPASSGGHAARHTTSEDATPVTEEPKAEKNPVEQEPPGPVEVPAAEEKEAEVESGPLGAELGALRAELDERTRDLQRLSAEYANYRKRVERDKGVVIEQATASVLTALLPVLDDLDRAREHGDLVGPFGTVADQLAAALAKFGLTQFGEKGDPFDPTRHEAVAHLTSTEVTEPSCVDVFRRGYLLGERLLRPALVAVADPE
jgi:molecular chaperone GrpE